MAEKKEKKIISADDGTVTTASEKKVKAAKPTGDAKKKRLVAVILCRLNEFRCQYIADRKLKACRKAVYIKLLALLL